MRLGSVGSLIAQPGLIELTALVNISLPLRSVRKED